MCLPFKRYVSSLFFFDTSKVIELYFYEPRATWKW